jgi:chemotaxis protein methyltransferase CheR
MVVASDNADTAGRRPFLLEQLSEFVETRMGLYFPAARHNDLERGIHSAAGEFGFDTVDSCIEWLLSSPLSHSQIETLAGHLTVGETYFFRDRNLFEILETRILPEIVNSRRGREQNLRIWSAGCSTGEEPYSLAILLTRVLPDLKNWNISILATDIAPLSLKKASEGVYSEWSFRGTPRWVEHGYFTEKQSKFAISPHFKRMVTFSHLNLAEDPYPAIINNTNGMDIIICRNVLMYFSRERANAVIANLARCLVDGGWLVTSPIESPGSDLSPLLQPVHFPGAILFRKAPKPKVEIIRPIAQPDAVKTQHKPAPAAKTPPLEKASQPNRLPPVPEPEPVSDDIGQLAARARLLADQGRLADALALCAAAIQADKLNPVSYYLQATILQEMGRAGDAAATLKRAIYIDQDFAIAHFSLGHLLQHEGKLREAGKHLHKARLLLQSYAHEEVLPEAEGLSAGRLIELIDTMQDIGKRR